LLFVVYLMMFSVLQNKQYQIIEMTANYEWQRM